MISFVPSLLDGMRHAYGVYVLLVQQLGQGVPALVLLVVLLWKDAVLLVFTTNKAVSLY